MTVPVLGLIPKRFLCVKNFDIECLVGFNNGPVTIKDGSDEIADLTQRDSGGPDDRRLPNSNVAPV